MGEYKICGWQTLNLTRQTMQEKVTYTKKGEYKLCGWQTDIESDRQTMQEKVTYYQKGDYKLCCWQTDIESDRQTLNQTDRRCKRRQPTPKRESTNTGMYYSVVNKKATTARSFTEVSYQVLVVGENVHGKWLFPVNNVSLCFKIIKVNSLICHRLYKLNFTITASK